ncbi:hypothetical protein EAO74_23270 [Streptomyces sp. gb1(2016)]|uniref:Uncharacterized protein n=1 Tax=Streptomyces sp. gb1(2016) TaxID=1828321 RepID=A0A652KIH5_9ACTN|nr:hypothetical protein EAO74_23270 [Streptomyces sp. gb1(2016)]
MCQRAQVTEPSSRARTRPAPGGSRPVGPVGEPGVPGDGAGPPRPRRGRLPRCEDSHGVHKTR